jgi:hypothetical protein
VGYIYTVGVRRLGLFLRDQKVGGGGGTGETSNGFLGNSFRNNERAMYAIPLYINGIKTNTSKLK